MEISALLNDVMDARPRRHSTTLTRAQTHTATDEYLPRAVRESPPTKKAKTRAKEAKDAPKFERGDVSGIVHYPPFEATTDETRLWLMEMHVYPETGIDEYPRHIPYSSERKGFQQQTGRDSFEVFQYTFKINGGGKEWTVMWDYNIGLVRITPFFKALGFAKTIPAKAIIKNRGLKDMCHSITGGALAAQGYWMPFEAARALAATFCHGIRHALIPIFGPDFVDECLSPESAGYNQFTIDAAIVAACARQVEGWTQGQVSSNNANNVTTALATSIRAGRVGRMVPAPFPPSTPEPELSDEHVSPKTLRPRRARSYKVDTDSEVDMEATSTPRASGAVVLSRWTAANLPASPAPSGPSSSMESPTLSVAGVQPTTTGLSGNCGNKRGWESIGDNDDDDGETDGDASSSVSSAITGGKRRNYGVVGADEARAAYMLLQLSVGGGMGHAC